MQSRTLGTLDVSALGLGCMSMSALYGPPGDHAEMIDAAAARIPLVGERLPEAVLEMTGL